MTDYNPECFVHLGHFRFYLEMETIGKHGKPKYQTALSSCADLHAQEGNEDSGLVWHKKNQCWVLQPKDRACIGSGLRIKHYEPDSIACFPLVPEIQIRPRSGLTKRGKVATLGTVDMDYRDEIMINLVNESDSPWIIQPGDRIAQAALVFTIRIPGIEVLDVKREGGFGSTGM